MIRIWVAATIGIFIFAATFAVTSSLTASFAVAVVATIFSGAALWKFSLLNTDRADLPRSIQIVSFIAILLALIQLGRLTVFIVSSQHASYSTIPNSSWEIRHSCLSAYYVAWSAVGKTPDIYDSSLYTSPDDDAHSVRKPRKIDRFGVDVYEYPPPFLLLSRFTSFFAPNFLPHRMLWFAMNGIVGLLAVLMIAGSLEGIARTRALAFSPLIWAAIPTLNTLQKGNVQLLIFAFSMIAMLLFKKKQTVSGGLLLAYAIASKLWPGVLIVYLLIRRKWRAIIATGVLGLVLTLVTLSWTGWQTFTAFFSHMPGLLSGEAFPAFRNPNAVAINISIPGVILKLKLFGVAGMTLGVSKIIGWIYTIFLLAIIALVARRSAQTDQDNALVWLAILILATLRSPFLPQSYGNFPALWLLTLIAAFYEPTKKNLMIVLILWTCLNVMVPLDYGVDPRYTALIILIPQTITLMLALHPLLKGMAPGRKAKV